MKKEKLLKGLLILAVSIMCFNSCAKDDNSITPQTDGKANPALLIDNAIPKELGNVYQKYFNRYTKVVCPNGGAIHIVAQDKITEGQIVRCRGVIEHYLKNLPNSVYGINKAAIANKMAENNAVLCLLNGQDDGKNPAGEKVQGQPLFQNEMQVEGHSWYMNQNYEHRDATFEEILHLVHDYGIGVDGPNSLPGALPSYQQKIRAAQENAYTSELWANGPNFNNQIKDWIQENSMTQEYLAAVVDSYYGLWGAWMGSSTHGMWGGYTAKNRDEVITEDPDGNTLITDFLHPYLTYNARIDASLDGNFSLKFDATKPYTHHSRYLKDITLTGSHNNSVTVNELDNDITGNAGSNTIIFSGIKADYTITTNNGETVVIDNVKNRDGLNTLRKVEKLQFTDQIYSL